ncbi:MAG TPA: DUF5069 domain-containing protein [Candidatus Cybelea sp.]|nr:DUF5069 domain-containing protein [Candidatus Cybelea sp.]
MTPLDLRKVPPRGVREKLLGFYFLARTVDKLRAELPGGSLGAYLNHDTGFSAWVIRRLVLDMDELRAVVAGAPDETAIVQWLAAHVDLSAAAALNEKLESFVVERMSPENQALVRSRHPVMAGRPDLSKILDVIEADDEHAFS